MHKTLPGTALIAAILSIAACGTFNSSHGPREAPIADTLASAVIHPQRQNSGKLRRKQALISRTGDALAAEEIGYYMDIQEAKLRQQLGDVGVSVQRTGDTITLSMPGRISFGPNSARLNPRIEPLLATIASVLVEFHKTLVSVHGHTDNSGPDGPNQKLSEQRSISVARYLLNQGVRLERLVVIGYGETRPIASNNTDQGREHNRRVELVLEPVSR